MAARPGGWNRNNNHDTINAKKEEKQKDRFSLTFKSYRDPSLSDQAFKRYYVFSVWLELHRYH